MLDISNKICNLTGHRCQDTPSKFEHLHPWKLEKLNSLEKYLKKYKPSVIISGMAIGFDMWGAFVALKLKIPLHCYIPCLNQDRLWSNDHKKQYRKYLEKANKIIYTSEGEYAAWKMNKRNDAMLKNSEAVLALWNPDKKYGGTYNTIISALSLAKPIINFWPEEPQMLTGLYK